MNKRNICGLLNEYSMRGMQLPVVTILTYFRLISIGFLSKIAEMFSRGSQKKQQQHILRRSGVDKLYGN